MQVLIDWELVRAALKLPADCGDEAKLRLAVQLANSSLAESQLSTEKHALQQQLDKQQQRLHMLAAQLEGLWLNGSSGGGSNGSISNSSSSTNSSALAHEVLEVQAAVESLQDKLHSELGVLVLGQGVCDRHQSGQLGVCCSSPSLVCAQRSKDCDSLVHCSQPCT